MDALSGASSSTAATTVPPDTAVEPPAKLKDNAPSAAARSPMLLASKPAAVGMAAEAQPQAEEATVARSSPSSSGSPATSPGEAMRAAGVLTADGDSSLQHYVELCPPPKPVSRSVSPNSPFLSPPSPALARTLPPRGPTSLDTSLPPDGGVGRGEDVVPAQNGSALLDIDASSGVTVPDPDIFDTVETNLCGEVKERHVSLKMEEVEVAGDVSGASAGETPKKSSRNNADIHPARAEKVGAYIDETRCTVAAVAKSSRPSGVIRPEEVAKVGSTAGGVEPGGAAGNMPTWVVKPAANSNCGFGIQVCCSLKVI